MILFCCIGLFGYSKDLFSSAKTAAQNKDYATAIKIYEEIIDKEPNNLSAQFNLGQCYFAEKQFGKAILHYEKSLMLDPNNILAIQQIEASYNGLNVATNWEPTYELKEAFAYNIGSKTWVILSLFGSILIGLIIFQIISKPSWLKIPIPYFFLVIGFIIVSISIYAGQLAGEFGTHAKYAIVTKKKITTLLNENGELGDLEFTEGTRLKIIEEKSISTKVEDPNGKEHLVLTTDLEMI